MKASTRGFSHEGVPASPTPRPLSIFPLRDLLPDHISPERLYLETRWASLVPYAAAGLLADVLPIALGANTTTVREHTLRIAERTDAALGEERSSSIDGCLRNGPLCRSLKGTS